MVPTCKRLLRPECVRLMSPGFPAVNLKAAGLGLLEVVFFETSDFP